MKMPIVAIVGLLMAFAARGQQTAEEEALIELYRPLYRQLLDEGINASIAVVRNRLAYHSSLSMAFKPEKREYVLPIQVRGALRLRHRASVARHAPARLVGPRESSPSRRATGVLFGCNRVDFKGAAPLKPA